ncbi:hypothetical protein B5P19_03725 [Clavibacter sepedonicus]|nr:hypothetical protein B5P19_03725 [Clavibacter sepedonicus]OQJ53037.1 hypothetical protein B5P20_01985 [Clavibacter sepedonicus]
MLRRAIVRGTITTESLPSSLATSAPGTAPTPVLVLGGLDDAIRSSITTVDDRIPTAATRAELPTTTPLPRRWPILRTYEQDG